MREYRLALATLASAFAMLLLGGLVHATGSAHSCAGWPLCEGVAADGDASGAALQTLHRCAAAVTALLTALLGLAVLRGRRDPVARALAAGALALVAAQAALGGAAVLFRLPLAASLGHAGLAIAFLAVAVALAERLREGLRERAPLPGGRALVGAAAVAALAAVLTGAVVRHAGAAGACGPGSLLCQGALWPDGGAARLHLAHRALAATAGVLAVLAAARAGRAALRAGTLGPLAAALIVPAVVLAQIALGQWALASGLSPAIATAHLGAGALLFATLLALWLRLAPGARRRAPGRARAAA